MTKQITVNIQVTYNLTSDYYNQLHGNADTQEQRREYALDRLISNSTIRLLDPAHEIVFIEQDVTLRCSNCAQEVDEFDEETKELCVNCHKIWVEAYHTGFSYGVVKTLENENRRNGGL